MHSLAEWRPKKRKDKFKTTTTTNNKRKKTLKMCLYTTNSIFSLYLLYYFSTEKSHYSRTKTVCQCQHYSCNFGIKIKFNMFNRIHLNDNVPEWKQKNKKSQKYCSGILNFCSPPYGIWARARAHTEKQFNLEIIY